MASNTGRAYFALAGYHFNPAHITELLGIEPTTTNSAGMGGSLDKPVLSTWELSSETVTDDVDVYKLLDDILKKIEPVKDKILQVAEGQNLSPRVGVVLTLSTDKGETTPDVGVGARMIAFLAELGAFIDIKYELSERI